MAERKNPKLDAQHQAILKRMMQLPENKNCADCKGSYPRWASTNLGIFICMTCSGIHRKLGTHISQVRSVTLDTWTPSQITHFQKLGNLKAEKYFEACLPSDFRRPHSSDSMKMEGFIREKYEHRRFITIENGGLGGNPVRGVSSGFSSLGSRPKQAPPPRQPYDDFGGSASSGLSHFSNKPQFHTPQPPAQSLSAARNPLARATTLKELVNMGFSTDISLRAVEASGGDLEQAVNWVLQTSNQPRKSVKPQVTVPVNNSETNLLDFGDESTINSTPNASAASTEKKPGSQPTSMAPAKPNHVAEFADFGDFESALPTPQSSHPLTQPDTSNKFAGKNAFRSNLADLYKKPPPSISMKQAGTLDSKLTSPISAVVGLKMSKSSPTSFTENKSFKSPDRGVSKVTMDHSKLGLPTIDLQNAKYSQGHLREQDTISGHVSNKSIRQPTPAPPAPPPMQEAAIMSTRDGPAPPSPSASTPPKVSEEKIYEDLPSEAPQSTASSEEKQTVVEDDEDPFAALSMMALSSATARKKNSKPNAKMAPIKDTNKGIAESSGNGSLDDMLG